MNLEIDDTLTLSDIQPSDKEAYIKLLNDPEIYRFTKMIPHPYTEKHADWWINHVAEETKKKGRSLTWAIRKDGELIGGAGFKDFDLNQPHESEIGYWLGQLNWGQGIMTKVVARMTEYGFQEFKLNRITANVFHFNPSSMRVLQKAGFQIEGYLRSHYVKDGKIFDGILFAKIADDSLRDLPLKRPENIKHFSEIQEKDDHHYPDSDELLSVGSPFAKKTGLKKLGIHHELLPPGRRTSYPHAESDEEEFIYVIEGTPDVWIDGHLHRLAPGDGVSFPAGTGSCHTFLNNTKAAVRLLVVGEATKPTNKIYYPLNPEREAQVRDYRSDAWWDDVPTRELGPHDGKPS